MKALYFAKIDYMKTRTQWYMMLSISVIVIVIMMLNSSSMVGQVNFMYGVFIAIVFSTNPFGACSRKDMGFQQLLPATTFQRVAGRFLFGMFLLLTGIGIGLAGTAVYCVLTGKAEFVSLPMCLLTFAVGVVIITVQYIFFYLVGESRGAQLLSLVRVLPSMCFFFVSMKVIGEIQKNPAEAFALLEKVGGNLDAIGWGGAVMALIVMMAGIVFCTRATAKKDY